MEEEHQASTEEKEVNSVNPENSSEKDLNSSFLFYMCFYDLERNQIMKWLKRGSVP